MIKINDNLYLSNENLRAVEARKIGPKENPRFIITLTYTDGRKYNFNAESEEEKNNALGLLTPKNTLPKPKRTARAKKD